MATGYYYDAPTGALASPHSVLSSPGGPRQHSKTAELTVGEIDQHAPILACPAANVRVYLPPLDEVVANWPVISAHLHKATIRTGCYEPVDLLRFAFVGHAGIWVCSVNDEIVAALVTEVKQYPRKRVLEILFCGGSRMRDWMKVMVTEITRHAKECGCDHLAGIGRPGWLRAWGGRHTGDIVIVRGLGEP